MPSLSELYLFDNAIGEEGAAALAEWFSTRRFLTHLDLLKIAIMARRGSVGG